MDAAGKCSHTERHYPVLTFFLDKERYAVPLSAVLEVNRLTKVKKVPKGPDYLVGLINLHGKTVPVLNLKSLLHLEPADLSPKAMWCAMRVGESIVCVAVDRLAGFMKFTDEDFDPLPGLAGIIDRCCIKGFARDGDEPMPVLDIAGLLGNLLREPLTDIGAGDHPPEGKGPETAEDAQARNERDQ